MVHLSALSKPDKFVKVLFPYETLLIDVRKAIATVYPKLEAMTDAATASLIRPWEIDSDYKLMKRMAELIHQVIAKDPDIHMTVVTGTALLRHLQHVAMYIRRHNKVLRVEVSVRKGKPLIRYWDAKREQRREWRF